MTLSVTAVLGSPAPAADAEAAVVASTGTGAAPDLRPRNRHSNTKVTVASFNVLGHRHTAGGGDKARWPSGVKRMRHTVRLLHRHRVSVVGFQELQPEQLHEFRLLTRKTWSLYPGNRLTQYASHNSLAWDTARWDLVEASTLRIPYLRGERVEMPVVKLKHRNTGQRVYFANFHNPADSKGPAQKWRNKARKKQIRLARRINALGVPLVLTGDMNEKERYFCAMTSKAPMHAANGGRHTKRGRCVPPDGIGIDWIFGSRRVHFRSYTKITRDDLHLVSDHPFLAARARIDRRRR